MRHQKYGLILLVANPYPISSTCPVCPQTSTNNWMTIKLVRIFGHLSPLEQRLGKKLVDPLTQIMTTTPAKSLLYECIRTVTHGLTNHTALVRVLLPETSSPLARRSTKDPQKTRF